MPRDRLVGRAENGGEAGADRALRPLSLADFVGQRQVRENLRVFIDAAKARGEALDHVLLSGPPGLGKTTLAQIISRELGTGFRATAAPAIAKGGDLAALLTNLQDHDVLFIDEIHRLAPAVEEILYAAMEDFRLDLMIGEGPAARSIRIELPPFTLVGATTRSGLITRPLRERFGIPLRLEFYDREELELIVHRAARLLDLELTKDGAAEIARRAGSCGGCATSPKFRGPRGSMRQPPTPRSTGWRWIATASTPWTGATSASLPETTVAAPWVSKRSRRRWGKSGMCWRRWSSPI